MATFETDFGETHFGSCDLGHKQRNRCLVKVANAIHRHPGGTLPHKLHQPKDYKAMDRLMNRPETTHAAVLEGHCQRTREQMRQAGGPLLVLHDTTELDYSGLHSIGDLGSIGGNLGRGYLCHNSLAFDPSAAALAWHGAAPIAGPSAPGVSARIGRMTQQLPQRFSLRLVPLQLSGLRSARGPERQLHLVLPQITQHAADAAQDGELLQDQASHLLHLLVGIELQFAGRPDDIARRRLAQPLAAPTAIQTAGLHALLELVQLETSQEAFDGQNQAIVKIQRMIDTILVGEQGIEGGANLDQATTGLVFAGQAIDLKAEDQADMVEGYLGQEPGKVVAADE